MVLESSLRTLMRQQPRATAPVPAPCRAARAGNDPITGACGSQRIAKQYQYYGDIAFRKSVYAPQPLIERE